jgi:hypothetical protein
MVIALRFVNLDMETLTINILKNKSALVKQIPIELGVVI